MFNNRFNGQSTLVHVCLFWVCVMVEFAFTSIHHDHYHTLLKMPRDVKQVESAKSKLDAAYWERRGAIALKYRFENLTAYGWPSPLATKPARNVILFMGDGMGITTVTAIRKLKQQLSGTPFYKTQLAWDSFPFSGFSKTFSVNDVIADSASTATAFLTGVNTKTGFIGVDATGDLNCSSSHGYVDSIAHWAFAAGKKTGFVTTTRITHASPSPLYAHSPWRDNELFANTRADDFAVIQPKCVDIAQQFVYNAKHISVALGGGRRNFLPEHKNGSRNDGRNLIQEWLENRGEGGKADAVYIKTFEELKSVADKKPDYLLGIFSSSHLHYVDDKPKDQPRLADMTEAAINQLNKHQHGYFLFVEGGRIDHGHHEGIARYALTEGVEFDVAVNRALSMVDLKETLVIVMADHSHTFSMGGSLRHEDNVLTASYDLAGDNKTYTSLAYANGPGAAKTLEGPEAPLGGTRKNISATKAVRPKFHQQATVLLEAETHGGEDIGVYAIGAYAPLFSGVFDHTYVAWAIACASGIHRGVPGLKQAQRLSELCPSTEF